jgi:hypothetical protein
LSAASTSGSLTFTRYYTGGWQKAIEPVDCTRETTKSVWVLEKPWRFDGASNPPVERRHERAGAYHNTWAEAKAHLIEVATNEVVYAREALKTAENILAKFAALSDPAAPSDGASAAAESSESGTETAAEALRRNEQEAFAAYLEERRRRFGEMKSPPPDAAAEAQDAARYRADPP